MALGLRERLESQSLLDEVEKLVGGRDLGGKLLELFEKGMDVGQGVLHE